MTAAVLVLTASNGGGGERFERIPVSGDGAVPGRPPTFVVAGGGPWTAARRVAVEAGVAPARLDEVVADAPGRHLLVPAAWTAPGGWSAFWGRAHRATNDAHRRTAAQA